MRSRPRLRGGILIAPYADAPIFVHIVLDLGSDFIHKRSPCSLRGALMRRLERGAGRTSGAGDAASSSGSRRPAIPGLGLERRPRCRLATGTRAAAGLRPEVLRPPARSWLTDGGHTFAPPSESAARRRKEDAAAERRKARRPPLLAGDLRAFPEIGPTARRPPGAALPHQRLSALCSPLFSGGGQRTKGSPEPHPNRRRSVGYARVIPGPSGARSPESINTEREDETERQRKVCGYGFRARAHGASQTRVNALSGAPRNDGRRLEPREV